MRRIFYAVPLKGRMPHWQVANLLDISRTRFNGCSVSVRILEGAPVNQARNELVQHARDEKFDELVFTDADLAITPKHLDQILTHDVPVVCGLYGHRCFTPTLFHVEPFDRALGVRADGLMRVRQSAIGFSKIKLGVFDQLQERNPDRCGRLTDRAGGTKRVWEFFPFELVGPNTPAARLKAIETLLEGGDADLISKIRDAVSTQYLEENTHMSEDYNFCRLCHEAGIEVYLDIKLIVQHASEEMLPIPTAALVDALDEPWRQSELAIIRRKDQGPKP